MKFYIQGGGDKSVGIWVTDVVVEFKGNVEFDKDLIQQTKEMLKEWDDNGATIFTEEEYDEYCKEMQPTNLEELK